mgnify:CR=1 FL=1
MKVGDIIMDHDIGQTGIIIERLPRSQPNHRSVVCESREHFRVLYEDGHFELINCDDTVEVVNESR